VAGGSLNISGSGPAPWICIAAISWENCWLLRCCSSSSPVFAAGLSLVEDCWGKAQQAKPFLTLACVLASTVACGLLAHSMGIPDPHQRLPDQRC
jgi:hypothetical protein